MTGWHIAQMNVADALYGLEDPRMAGFVERLDEINALAERSPGFVWRLKSESGNATDILVTDDPAFLINMSVWETVEALFDYVYKSDHRGVMTSRRQWFRRPDAAFQVLWWVKADHVPSAEDGLARLAHMRTHGPTEHAFDFKNRFPQPGTAGEPEDMNPDPFCVGWT